jgi:hypothetical protein
VTSNELSHATLAKDSAGKSSVRNNPLQGSATSKIVNVNLSDGRMARVVFKPKSGEFNYSVFRKGTLYKREVAASRLNDELGFSIVPPTVEMTIDGEVGSAQLYVENIKDNVYPWARDQIHPVGLNQMKVLDYVMFNLDRRGLKNWFVREKDGTTKAFGIDNNLSFPQNQSEATVESPGEAQPKFPDEILPETRALLAKASPERIARALVSTGLEDASIKGALTRLEEVRTHGTKAKPRSSDNLEAIIAAAHRSSGAPSGATAAKR